MDFSSEPSLGELAAVLRPIARRAGELDLGWVLIGAAARDLLLVHARGFLVSRRTQDTDVALLVDSWDEFAAFRDLLVREEGARLLRNRKQRIVLPGGAVDVVPCGGIEEDGWILWPPDDDPLLDVRGLREAISGAARTVLPGSLEVPIVRLHHFLGLKLLAWRDRRHRKPMHDSVDVGDLLARADDLFDLEVLHRDHPWEMEAADWDPARAALRVLGGRLSRSIEAPTRNALVDLLQAELDQEGRLELLRELRAVPRAGVLLGDLRAELAGRGRGAGER